MKIWPGPFIHVVPFSSVSSIVYRARKATLPALPATLNDVIIQDDWANTPGGAPFLLFNKDIPGNGKERMSAFYTTSSVWIHYLYRPPQEPARLWRRRRMYWEGHHSSAIRDSWGPADTTQKPNPQEKDSRLSCASVFTYHMRKEKANLMVFRCSLWPASP